MNERIGIENKNETMENNRNYFSCFRFLDSKGRRMSIFAREEIDIEGRPCLMIDTITCSNEDQFDRKKSIALYEENKIKNIPTLLLIENEMSHRTFMDWCYANYTKIKYKPSTKSKIQRIIIQLDYLGEKQ